MLMNFGNILTPIPNVCISQDEMDIISESLKLDAEQNNISNTERRSDYATISEP